MTKTVSALIVVLLLSATALGEDPEPYLKAAPMPFYPPLARQARYEGKVLLRFAVNEQGDTSEVEAVTGHQMVRQAAIESVQGWKFGWPHPCACRVKREAIFVYKISGELESPDRPNVTVKWFGKTGVIRVEIEGTPFYGNLRTRAQKLTGGNAFDASGVQTFRPTNLVSLSCTPDFRRKGCHRNR